MRLFCRKEALFLRESEYEFINANLPTTDMGQERRWIQNLWAGAGYTLKVSEKLGLNILLLYNPLYDQNNSPYYSPWDIRVGFIH
ncbi:hypothetical protein [Hugenholtzia roseola]|uniref:hypothetical protein n=1 Tax=Hugenholtzia roseola TaxID=1002 RepID=UPI00042A0AA5|nr:hypothetical protein [Hugenholtzia roseola]